RALLRVDGLARPEVRDGEEAVDLRVDDRLGLLEVRDERLPHARTAARRALAVLLARGAAEDVARLGEAAVTDDEVRGPAHALDDVAADGPHVPRARDVALHGEGVHALLLEGLDRVEPVGVA